LTNLYQNLFEKDDESCSRSKSHVRLLVAEAQSSYTVNSQQWVEVLVDCPGIQGLYTYSLPTDLTVRGGDIVSVPFGMQIT
jgi:primosomal protein N' (replication factor Y)